MTGPFSADLLRAVDARVAAAQTRHTAVGTVTSRTFDNWAMVTFDGSALAVPVKVSADVEAYGGDRVCLVRFGSDWTVVGSFTRRWPAESGYNAAGTVGSTTSATFTAMPGSPSFEFTKRWNTTRVRVTFSVSAYSGAGTNIEFGITLGSTTVTVIKAFQFSTTSVHTPLSATEWVSGVGAGTHTVSAVWRRPSGAAAIQFDFNDFLSFGCAEVAPA